MIDELKLLKGSDYIINEDIQIRLPRLSEITEYGEQRYYNMVSAMCATPSDYKSILMDNFNIDYEMVGDFEFFIMMWGSIREDDISILFPNINAVDYKPAVNQDTDVLALIDEKSGRKIDEVSYLIMVEYLRKLHGFEKKIDKAGNEATKKYLINKARKELQRNNKSKWTSILSPLISSMINCEQFKYEHTTVWDLNIYQFMDSVKRIQKLKSYNQIMQGVYAGTVDSKNLSSDTINWMGALK